MLAEFKVVFAFLLCATNLKSDNCAFAKDTLVIVGPGLAFDPKVQEINVGDTVVFRWAYPDPGQSYGIPTLPNGKVGHTVTKSISLDEKCKYLNATEKKKREIFHSEYQESEYIFNVTFDEVETVTYHCETTGESCLNCDGGMWGQIFVREANANYKKPSRQDYILENKGPAPKNKQFENAGTFVRSQFAGFTGK